MPSLRIVSRESPLAMWQAEFVRATLLRHYPELDIPIIGVKTTGDKWLETPLYKIGGKSVFVKELQTALLENKADLAVHSLKDVPAEFPEQLGLVAICERESPFDAWVCPKGTRVEDLPPGSRVGTSSLRRIVQLQQLRPDLEYAPLRGNVNTRLQKCHSGEWAAIVLAEAGLSRLGLQSQITSTFQPQALLPAVGQGALAIECRLADNQTRSLLSVLEHTPTRICITAERAMNAALGGNCQVAVAGFAQITENNTLRLIGRVGDPEQKLLLEAQQIGSIDNPIALGQAVAQDLIAKGATAIIERMKAHAKKHAE